MGIKTSKMMIQRDSDKWQRPQDIASLLSRTAREVLMIVKKYGCRMKVVDKEIWINCEDLLLRDNPPPNKKIDMYSSGFILLYRDELEDWLFQDPQLYHWWMYLRLKATPKPCVQIVGKTRIRATLGYGEFATTISYLAKVWDADDRTVSSFLNLIEEDGRIETRKENGITIIRIREYMRFSPPSGYFTKMCGVGRIVRWFPECQMKWLSKRIPKWGDDMSPPMESDLQSEVQTNKINLEEEKLKNLLLRLVRRRLNF